MNPRTHEYIALDTTGNIQGMLKLFGIYNVTLIERRKISHLLIPKNVTKKLNDWERLLK